MPDDRFAEPRIDRIRVKGGPGAALAILVIIVIMLHDLPRLRGPVLGSMAAGVVLGIGLILWRRRRGIQTDDRREIYDRRG